MKKSLGVLVVVLCSLVIMAGVASAHTTHFDLGEANQLVSGTWYDTERHHTINVPQIRNIIDNRGYTDPMGDSVIFFTRIDGVECRMKISYNASEDKYYARYATAYTDGGDALQWHTWWYSLVRQ